FRKIEVCSRGGVLIKIHEVGFLPVGSVQQHLFGIDTVAGQQVLLIRGVSDGAKDRHNGDDNHQLNKRKASKEPNHIPSLVIDRVTSLTPSLSPRQTRRQ